MEKVLLISPRFFEYHFAICEGIRELGMELDWYDDLPNTKSVVRALGRLNSSFISVFARRYFERMLKCVEKTRYQKVILLRSMSFCFTEDMMQRLRSVQKDAEFILYLWDSAQNLSHLDWILKYFNRCFSFDPYDTTNSGRMCFLPLFYTKPYEEAAKRQEMPVYDCFYYGTAHPQKLTVINTMADKLRAIYPNMLICHYMPSRFKYVYHKFSDRAYAGFRYSYFRTQKLSMAEMAEYVGKSHCVLDSPQGGQRGLTMRTLECIGAKRKLITANADIRNYDFYREENICIYENGFDFTSRFFTEPYKELPQYLYEKYSLRSWLCTFVGQNTEEK